MANPFVHVELSTTDPEKAKSFYSNLFSWKMEDTPMGPGMTYTLCGRTRSRLPLLKNAA
ncbi:MAG: VOC family protein [Vicinamibacterales bacterium]